MRIMNLLVLSLPLVILSFNCPALVAAASKADYDKLNQLLTDDASFTLPNQKLVATNDGAKYTPSTSTGLQNSLLNSNVKFLEYASSLSVAAGHLSDKQVHESMSLAKKHYREFSGKPETMRDGGLFEALKQFVSLDKLFTTKNLRCSEEMNSIVQANLNCADFPRRYVDSLVVYYRDLHGKLCEQFFEDKFEAKLGKMNTKTLEQVTDVLSKLILEYVATRRANMQLESSVSESSVALIFSNLDFSLEPLGLKESTRLLFDRIKFHLDDQQRGAKLKQMAKPSTNLSEHSDVAGLFDEYVVDPCKYFVEKLGPNFELASEIGAIAPKINKSSQSLTIGRFYQGWVQYKFCKAFIEYGANQMAIDTFELGIHERE